MTMPKPFRPDQTAAERGRAHGAESLHMYEAAQRAIEETRQLLDTVALQTRRMEGERE